MPAFHERTFRVTVDPNPIKKEEVTEILCQLMKELDNFTNKGGISDGEEKTAAERHR